jgi:hypothetical protein
MSCALIVVLATATANADDAAPVCEAARNVTPITSKGLCVGFIAHDAGGKEVSRVATGYAISGRILASADGRSVVMIHDAPTGTLDGKDALVFFRDGKRVVTYTMQDVIVRMSLVTARQSRTIWIAGTAPALELGATLQLTTTSQRKLVFDVTTGKLISAENTTQWNNCDVIAYVAGRIDKPSYGYYSVPKPRVARGGVQFSDGLTFRTEKLSVEGRSSVTLCLMPSTRGWVATEIIDVVYNVEEAPSKPPASR